MNVPISESVLRSIEEILTYNFPDEEDDYMEHGQEPGHVYEHLLTIDKWLDGIRNHDHPQPTKEDPCPNN